MTKPPSDPVFTPKPAANPRIYAYSISSPEHAGLLKVGQTTRQVKTRVEEQLKTAGITKYKIHLDEQAVRDDGTVFSDHDVRELLKAKGFANPRLEWMRCAVDDVQTAIQELRTGKRLGAKQHHDFPMRAEQLQAVEQTWRYYQKIWNETGDAVPRFLWNAKMRFGKTFAAYQLAKKMNARRVLVLTFKPAVEDAWQSDLESHVDFADWQFYSRQTLKNFSLEKSDPKRPLVYFGSFQDLLGRDDAGNVKALNEWIHELNWDLVIFDEYHFGAWRETAQDLFEGEEDKNQNFRAEYDLSLEQLNEMLELESKNDGNFLPITTRSFLYLSGTPFRALAHGEFIEDQIFNWTYTDEQRAKRDFASKHPKQPNPYAALPQMQLLTYKMPDELLSIASEGELDEFDLNLFFRAKGSGEEAEFLHKDDVQKWLNIIRGSDVDSSHEQLKMGSRPPFPYSDTRLLPYLQHSFWFLPNVAACHAMANLLAERHNVFWHDYQVLVAAGADAGIGLKALPPVREAIRGGFDTKTITLSCGKLTTGITIPAWSSILMLRNLQSPETYFQAAFRVQSPWSLKNPHGDDPLAEEILKPECFVFDFAPTRALRQVVDYGIQLSPGAPSPELAVHELLSFLPVLAYDGAKMTQLDADSVLDISVAGTSGSLLARKWESPVLVNVDNETLTRLLNSPEALAAVEKIEGWRSLGDNVIETIINESQKLKKAKEEAKGTQLDRREKKVITDAEKELRSKRRQVREKLVKFATRIPAFMYLTDFRENTLQDVITKLEPELFRSVTGLTVADFHLLVELRVFNTEKMNQAVFAFRRYEDDSLNYTGLASHGSLSRVGGYDSVIDVA